MATNIAFVKCCLSEYIVTDKKIYDAYRVLG